MPNDVPTPADYPITNKRAYTVAEVAAMTGFSRDTIIRLFEKEPGVIILNQPTAARKRRYRTMRIPGSVFERVLRRLTVK